MRGTCSLLTSFWEGCLQRVGEEGVHRDVGDMFELLLWGTDLELWKEFGIWAWEV